MKIQITPRTREVIKDPRAREELRQALADGEPTSISVGRNRYKLVPLYSADGNLELNAKEP
jgi:hypothetical protein